ncbi:dTDP-glucose 4,6-dehydratase [Sphaerochaeta sp.]|uniref:dTDP-glucose 4,6-dehydratase n=1 Tax=Sphaerochaeta sp. TaxID=1972642 RepID=UPI003D139AFF
MRAFRNIAVTGGAGFIGSNFIRHIFQDKQFSGRVINIDKLTYAGNAESLADVQNSFGGRYFFEKIDICDFQAVKNCFERYNIDCVIHFAAESHVDRSIHGPAEFIQTNIVGTFNLLEVCRQVWNGGNDTLFHHVSTDEVFGSLGDTGYFYETTPYDPRSPYSASKASSDHIVSAYHHTYGLNVTMSNCTNNYGPYQFPEKLIPVMLLNMLDEKPLPVYGDGMNIRDWLYVIDHCSGIWAVVQNGRIGETYNIGGENEWTNIDLVNRMCELVAVKTGKDKQYYKKLITYVKDRLGHDRRYAIKCDKIKSELGWNRSVTFDSGLSFTIDWYLANQSWIESIKSGEYLRWVDKNYIGRD